jgi:hypothetical protein
MDAIRHNVDEIFTWMQMNLDIVIKGDKTDTYGQN